jgi:hypothetical protein
MNFEELRTQRAHYLERQGDCLKVAADLRRDGAKPAEIAQITQECDRLRQKLNELDCAIHATDREA